MIDSVSMRAGTARDDFAFTLIELLVVIAIVGILASLVLPALAKSKSLAQGAYCQNNSRQLISGCLMYCDDSQGYFPYNMAGTNVHTNINWASDVLDWENTSDNTNILQLTGAALGQDLGQSVAPYHCPSDNVLSPLQSGLGWDHRARSYSMNASVGDAGAITASGVNTNNPGYVQFFKHSSIPQPSQIFVFTEEHPDTISDGYFLNDAYSHEWMRLPASYHNGCANLSFADGHAEFHQWLVSSTMPPSVPDGATNVLFVTLPADQRTDFAWIISHMTVKSN